MIIDESDSYVHDSILLWMCSLTGGGKIPDNVYIDKQMLPQLQKRLMSSMKYDKMDDVMDDDIDDVWMMKWMM